MPRLFAALAIFLAATALVALPPIPKGSTDPATPIALKNGRILWVRAPEVQGETVIFFDAAGQVRSQLKVSEIDWPKTHEATEAHQRRIAETGEAVRTLKLTGDPQEAHRLAQSSEAARKSGYQEAMKIPLQTQGEKDIIKADELEARMKIAQAKCDALGVPIGPWTSAASIAWIQASIRMQCESFKREALKGLR